MGWFERLTADSRAPLPCPQCGNDQPRNAIACSRCGHPLSNDWVWQADSPKGRIERVAEAKAKRERDAKIMCPQCQTSGFVATRSITAKVGVSGAKATGAILTGGLSLFATGLSRKQPQTEAHCSNCGSVWHFA